MIYYFIRHFQSEGNVDPSIYYKKYDYDIDLTEYGFSQVHKTSELLVDYINSLHKHPSVINLYHSPFLRTSRTAQSLMTQIAYDGIFPNVNISPLLSEKRGGENSGLCYNDFMYRPSDGESFMDVYQRAVTFDNSLMHKHSSDDHTIIVSHGQLIQCYIMYLMAMTPETFLKHTYPQNGEIIVFDSNKKKLLYGTGLKLFIKN